MKTQNEILADIRDTILSSTLGSLVDGVYVNSRKVGSTGTDCVINTIVGNGNAYTQTSSLYIRIFYTDHSIDGTWYQDVELGNQLQRALFELRTTLLANLEYKFTPTGATVMSEQPEELRDLKTPQRYELLKINFQNIIL